MGDYYSIGSVGPLFTSTDSDAVIPDSLDTDGLTSDPTAKMSDLPHVTASWPIGSVYWNITNVDPGTELGEGTWAVVGNTIIGGITLYAWQRTA